MGQGGTGLCQLPPGLLQRQHEHIGQARDRGWGLLVMVGPSSGCPHGEACFPARFQLLNERNREAGYRLNPSSLTSHPRLEREALRVPSIPEVLQNIFGSQWPLRWASVPSDASALPCPCCWPAC